MAQEGERRVGVHPLALATIADHCTRVRVGGSPLARDAPVIGLLFGVQQGLQVSIHDAAEATYTPDAAGACILDAANVNSKKDLTMAVFPQYELLGWYRVGSQVEPSDLVTHRAFSAAGFNEAPLFVLLTPPVPGAPEARQLPLAVFESEVHVVDAVPTTIFVPLQLRFETAPVEQMSVQVVASSSSVESTALAKHHNDVRSSLRTLEKSVCTILAYCERLQSGEAPVNHATLRRIGRIVSQLPLADSNELTSDMAAEALDALMVAYLAAVTNAAETLASVNDKYALAYSDRMGRRGML